MSPSSQLKTQPQAFARAYRPQVFSEVQGQEHVLKALAYSLDHNNLHHAYLLTGTRGVGKTTLGRIFAKALNCERGVSANPCGVCSACESIGAGRFVDLIEVDGASNTKVEDTRELLEDVQFVPTQGRFKIYLIDEVHMLSTHSFNALLKTLEEPPEHVKFILATTDPQKLPVTVLSRCLQFHLQLLSIPLIQQHVEFILNTESVPFEPRATYLLAQAAKGSMRDALTLTDQARNQGQGSISAQTVTQMLGILDQQQSHQLLLDALTSSASQVLESFAAVEITGADPDQILKDLVELCHQVAITQALGEAGARSLFDDQSLCELLTQLAQSASAEQIQLCYETLLAARKTLPYASSPSAAVRMALLRMTCFQCFNSEEAALTTDLQKKNPEPALEQPILKPQASEDVTAQPAPIEQNNTPPAPETAAQEADSQPVEHHFNQQTDQSAYDNAYDEHPTSSAQHPVSSIQHLNEHLTEETQSLNTPIIERPEPTSLNSIEAVTPEPVIIESPTPEPLTPNPKSTEIQTPALLQEPNNWFEFLKAHSPGGLFGQLLLNTQVTQAQQIEERWKLHVIVLNTIFSYDALESPSQLSKVLSEVFKQPVDVQMSLVEHINQAPSELKIKERTKLDAQFQQRIQDSSFVTRLKELMPVEVADQSSTSR